MSNSFKVTLKPSGEVVIVQEGKNLLEALREQNIYIKSSCGGHATCSDCVIKIVSGEDYITPPPFAELKLLGNVFHITKERLACQTCLTGDVTIDIGKHDLATDEAKLKNKTSNFSKKKLPTRIRKEPDIEKLKTERADERAKAESASLEKTETWKKHWEKNQDSEAPKKLAGGKRPKFFDTDKVDYENNNYSRPLSAEKQKLRDERLETEKLKAENDKKSASSDSSNKEYKKFRE
jgi:ferredoxin